MMPEGEVRLNVVRLPAGIDLLQAQRRVHLDSLLACIGNWDSHHENEFVVNAIQQVPALEQDLNVRADKIELLRDVFVHTVVFRQVTAALRAAKTPWVFVGTQDCTGSQWELAKNCAQRLWFSLSAGVGDETQGPLVNVTEALMIGEINFVGSVDHHDLIPGIVQRWAACHAQDLRKHPRLETIPITVAEATEQYLQHHEKWLDIVAEREHAEGGAVRLDRRITNDFEREYFTCFATALHLVRNGAPARSSTCELFGGDVVFVAVNERVPPVSVLRALMRDGAQVVFVANHADVLAARLTGIFQRLAEAVGRKDAETLWEAQGSWLVGRPDAKRTVVSFATDGCWTITVAGGSALRFLRCAGLSDESVLGVSEALEADREDAVSTNLCKHLTSIVVFPRNTPQIPFPLSYWAYLMWLQEIIKVANRRGKPVNSVLSLLEKRGWRRTNKEVAERLFRSKELSGKPGVVGLHDSFLRAASWSDAVKLNTNSGPESLGSDAHFSILIAVLSSYLVCRGSVADAQEADALCTDATGYPSDHEPLAQLRDKFGRRRMTLYTENHWPELAEVLR